MASRRAKSLRENATEAERKLWAQLRQRQIDGHRFRRQHPIGRYVVDFICLPAKLVIEVDGGQHAVQLAGDAARTAWLESRGYRVERFWNNDVLGNIEGVVETVRGYLRDRESPPPQPSPSWGEGAD